MEKKELDEILENHVKWLNEDGGERANLREADLEGANLREADLRGTNLTGTNLRDACLRDVNLRGADLRGADLRGADLRGANLGSADLRGTLLPTGVYQVVGAESHNRCTTYDSINDLVICGCWSDGEGNHLNSFVKRIEEIYGVEGEEPNLKYYTEYMSAVAFFKAMKELKND